MKVRKGTVKWLLGVMLISVLIAGVAHGQDFPTYGYKTAEINLPTVGGGEEISWFTAVENFRDGTTDMIGNLEAEGRLLAATGRKLYLQRNYGSDQWDVVATVAGAMDPSFVRISPDGTRVALGIGYGAPLLVFPTSMLNPSSPPVLHDGTNPAAGVTAFDVNYYDAAWADNQYLVINGGQWPGPPYGSGAGVLDANDPGDTGTGLIGNIPGASASIGVDASGNLYTGIGYATYPTNRTGEIKVWAMGEWSTTPGAVLDYEANARVVANNVLSAAYLGADSEGNLHVGGGDAFGVGGPTENGYAALISRDVVARVTAPGTPGAPVDEGNSTLYREFAPDPCANDSATGILYGNWGKGMAVMWNPSNATCNPGSAEDYWLPFVEPRLTVYYPVGAPDADGDGVPDSADNAYLTPNAGQQDTDGDGWGNAADADFSNNGKVNSQDFSYLRQAMGSKSGDPNYDADIDMNSDGRINSADFSRFRGRLGSSVPLY